MLNYTLDYYHTRLMNKNYIAPCSYCNQITTSSKMSNNSQTAPENLAQLELLPGFVGSIDSIKKYVSDHATRYAKDMKSDHMNDTDTDSLVLAAGVNQEMLVDVLSECPEMACHNQTILHSMANHLVGYYDECLRVGFNST